MRGRSDGGRDASRLHSPARSGARHADPASSLRDLQQSRQRAGPRRRLPTATTRQRTAAYPGSPKTATPRHVGYLERRSRLGVRTSACPRPYRVGRLQHGVPYSRQVVSVSEPRATSHRSSQLASRARRRPVCLRRAYGLAKLRGPVRTGGLHSVWRATPYRFIPLGPQLAWRESHGGSASSPMRSWPGATRVNAPVAARASFDAFM